MLAFTPMASIGASGSVGNAGVQFPKCPTDLGEVTPQAAPEEECPPIECPTGPSLNVAFVGPDDCPPPVTPCPDGSNPGNAGIVAPNDCPEPEVPVTEPEAPVTEPEVPVTEPDDDIAGAGAENAPTPPSPAAAPAVGRTELARTGIDRNQVISTLVGLSLVGAGSALLVASRRRAA